MKGRFGYVLIVLLTVASLLVSGIVLLPGTAFGELSNPTILTGHLPIEINGDSDFTAANGVVSGTGTPVDPYIIANWKIDCNDTAHGIYIHGDITKNFVIRNCHIYNGSDYYGIYVFQATATDPDFTIDNCNISDCDMGLYVNGLNPTTLYSGDVTVLNSTFYYINSNGYGVFYTQAKGEFWMDNCSFIENSATSLVLDKVDADMHVSNTVFDSSSHMYHIYTRQYWAPTVYSGRVFFDNLTFEKTTTAVPTTAVILLDNLMYGGNLSNLVIKGHPRDGIRATSHYLNLTDSLIEGVGGYAVQVQPVLGSQPAKDLFMDNVRMNKVKWGVDSTGVNHMFVNCRFENMTDTVATDPVGLRLNEATGQQGHTVESCYFSGAGSGIWNWADKVLIANNTIKDTYVASSGRGNGIHLYGNDIEETMVRGNVIKNATTGIYIDLSDGLVVKGNWITDSDTGILLKDNVNSVTIWGNYIYDNIINGSDEDTTVTPENSWNEAYANGGGNYWGNYTGADHYNGVNQDIWGADGFGDSPYALKGSLIFDYYPIMRLPDLDAPTSSISVTKYWNNKTVSMVWQAWDNSWLRSVGVMYAESDDNVVFSSFQFLLSYSVEGVYGSGYLNLTDAEEGYYRGYTNATDFANNVETDIPPFDVEFGVDLTAPNTSVDALPATTENTTFDISYSYQDNRSGIQTVELWQSNSTDGLVWDPAFLAETWTAPTFSNHSFTGSADMHYRFYTRGTDNVGNYEDPPLVNDTEVEIVPPVILNDPPVTTLTVGSPKFGTDPLWVTNKTVFDLGATDDHGIDFTWYSLNSGGIYKVYTGNFTVPVGTTEVIYGSMDVMGLNETAKKFNVTVDVDPPLSILAIGQPKSGLSPVVVDDTTPFNLSASDSGCGVEGVYYRLDNGTWKVFTENFTISGYGAHTLDYYSRDNLGNTEAARTVKLSYPQPVPPLPKIAGKVIYKLGDLAGKNATNATVQLLKYNETGAMSYIKNGTTNATGSFLFVDVAAGSNYTIRVTPEEEVLYEQDVKSGYKPKETAQFIVATADLIKDMALEWYEYVEPLPMVSGSVVYNGGELDGQPASGASVTIRNSTGAQVKTLKLGSDGNFSFELGKGMGYSIEVVPLDAGALDESSGYLAWSDTFDLSGDKDFNIKLVYYTYIAPPMPTITIGKPDDESVFEPGEEFTVSGSSTDLAQGAPVKIEVGGEFYYTTIGGDGSWSTLVNAPKTAGSYNIIVTAGPNGTASHSVWIEVEAEEESFISTNTMIIIAALVIALIVALILAILLWMRRKEEAEEKEFGPLEAEEAAVDKETECPTCGAVFIAAGHETCPECGEELPEPVPEEEEEAVKEEAGAEEE